MASSAPVTTDTADVNMDIVNDPVPGSSDGVVGPSPDVSNAPVPGSSDGVVGPSPDVSNPEVKAAIASTPRPMNVADDPVGGAEPMDVVQEQMAQLALGSAVPAESVAASEDVV